MSGSSSIKAIDAPSVHRITSGQVVIDLQTAVKELVENSIDAGATNIEVRFKQYGLSSIEVIDNGSGIAPEDYDSVALKHHTSKLKTFADLTSIISFGFRGEAISSLCALCETISITTARSQEAPVGAELVFDKNGATQSKAPIARQRGTTVSLTNIFTPLPVRRKELERNIKREYGKALNLLNAYALGPCAKKAGIRLSVTNQLEGGRKSVQIRTEGTPSVRASVSALWGPKALANIVELDLTFEVETSKLAIQRLSDLSEDGPAAATSVPVQVKGLTSKFAVGCGRTGTDRQFFYVNGRPCNMNKIQKAFNEIYRSFSVKQSPFLVVDIILPTESCDVNVSPDKRTIFIHSEENLVTALKATLEETFAPERSTFDLGGSQMTQTQLPMGSQASRRSQIRRRDSAASLDEEDEEEDEEVPPPRTVRSKSQQSKTTKGTTRGASGRSKTIADSDEEDVVQELHVPSTKGKKASGNPTSSRNRTPDMDQMDVDESDSASRSRSAAADDEADDDEDTDRNTSDELDPDTSMASLGGREVTPPTSEVASSSSLGDILGAKHLQSNGSASKVQKSRPPPRETPSKGRRGSASALHPGTPSTLHPGTPSNVHQLPSISSFRRQASAAKSPSVGVAPATKSPSVGRGASGRNAPFSLAKKKDATQTTLSTFGASWSQQIQPPASSTREALKAHGSGEEDSDDDDLEMDELQDAEGSESPPRKRRRVSVGRSSSVLERRASPVVARRSRRGVDPLFLPEEPEETTMDVDVGSRASVEKELVERETATPRKPDSTLTSTRRNPDTSSTGRSARNRGRSSSLDLFAPDPDTSSASARDIIDLSILEDEPEDESDTDSSIQLVEFLRNLDDNEEITLRLDVDRLQDIYANSATVLQIDPPSQGDRSSDPPLISPEASVANTEDNESAADALSRVIGKVDFAGMEILAQFNRGFIIARRRTRGDEDEDDDVSTGLTSLMDDLFIVDQHASDEKYNFETLQETTRIQSQKLFKPLPLELTAADELLALDNLGILEQNGFEFQVQDDRPVGQKLLVTAQPVSKDTSYTLKDLEELILLLHDAPPGRVVRCSKARAMFASRACRKSVMIGRSLTTSQMTTIVRHMGSMDQPWNCPHGRPTMRHLSNIGNLGTGVQEYKSRRVNWEKLPVFDA